MIYKNARMDDRTDVTVVEFGTGDIRVVGLDWDEENAHGVLFSEDVPKDITKWNTVDNVLRNISEAKNPVILRFSRVESIDQLIDSLIEVRNAFKLNSSCSEKPNGQICGDCDAYCECQMAGAEHNDAACPGVDDSVLSQHKERGKHGH